MRVEDIPEFIFVYGAAIVVVAIILLKDQGGRVLEISVVIETSAQSMSESSTLTPPLISYPEIEYEYIVNDDTHSGNIVSFEKENVWVAEVDKWGNPTPKEKRWWLSLKPGDELTAYINPHNDNEALLVKEVVKTRRSHHLALMFGGLLVGLIWLVLVYYNQTTPESVR